MTLSPVLMNLIKHWTESDYRYHAILFNGPDLETGPTIQIPYFDQHSFKLLTSSVYSLMEMDVLFVRSGSKPINLSSFTGKSPNEFSMGLFANSTITIPVHTVLCYLVPFSFYYYVTKSKSSGVFFIYHVLSIRNAPLYTKTLIGLFILI